MTREEQIEQYIKDVEAVSGETISYEEAVEQLTDMGQLPSEGNGSGGFPFVMEGIEGLRELRACSLFGSSTFLAYNMAVKKQKGAGKFEEGEFYLGTQFKKDDDGNLILDECEMGENVSEKANIIVIGNSYYKNRTNYEDNDIEPVMTTFGSDSFEAGQKSMIDKNTGKSAWDFRSEQIKEFGSLQEVPKKQKISTMQYVYGLVETEDGWKPFWHKMKLNLNEDSLSMVIQELIKEKQLSKKIISYENYYDQKSQGFFKKASIEGDVGKNDSEIVLKSTVQMGKAFSDLKKDQLAHVDGSVKKESEKESTDSAFDDDDDIAF